MTINKRVAISFLTIVGVMSLVVALTIAQFTDTAQITGNTFSTGSGNLLISDEFESSCVLESFGTAITGLSGLNLAPGQSASKNFCLLNKSDSNIALNVTAAVSNVSGTLSGDSDLVNLTIVCPGNAPVVGTLASFPSTVITTLSQNDQVDCTVTAELDEDANNDQANKTISFDVTFTGTQAE